MADGYVEDCEAVSYLAEFAFGVVGSRVVGDAGPSAALGMTSKKHGAEVALGMTSKK